MKRKLLTVEEAFQISGRGVVVAPAPLESEIDGPADIPVELRKPDGTAELAQMCLGSMFQTPPPPPGEQRWVCLFQGLTKAQVPVGTEIWYEADDGP